MILYTNGSGHTAGAECANMYSWAEEDPRYVYLERRAHPDNIHLTWGPKLADALKYSFHTDAEAGRTNEDIIETTKEWIERTKPKADEVFYIIQWAEWQDSVAAHETILKFHDWLNKVGYTDHLFFNGYQSFVDIPDANRYNYGVKYLDPYADEGTFSGWLRAHGHDTVITSNIHFGPHAQAEWAKHLLRYFIKNGLV